MMPLGAGSEIGVMGNIDHGFAGFGQARERLKDAVRRPRVQVAGRLIGNHDWRIVRQRPRNRDALLLPSGKFAGQTLGKGTQARRFQAHLRALTPGSAGEPAPFAQFQRQQDILYRGEGGDQLEELENNPHVLSAPARQSVLTSGVQFLGTEDHAPAAWAVDAGQHVEQG